MFIQTSTSINMSGCPECARRRVKKESKVVRAKLFESVSTNGTDEDEICEMLDTYAASPEHLQHIINTPMKCLSGDESMLMWAVWTLKPKVVNRLIELGADVKFENAMGHSAATYWRSESIQKREDDACEIAKILYEHGVDLAGSRYSDIYSVLKMARKYNFAKLRATIEALDPKYTKVAFTYSNPTAYWGMVGQL